MTSKLSDEQLKRLIEASTPGPWSHYSGKLRPQFPTLIHEIHNRACGPVVKWAGFDGLAQPARMVKANAALIAAAPDLARELLSLRSAGRWIPVETQLPEADKWVLAWRKQDGMPSVMRIPSAGDGKLMLFHDGTPRWDYPGSPRNWLSGVTHWQPLPLPPSETTKE